MGEREKEGQEERVRERKKDGKILFYTHAKM